MLDAVDTDSLFERARATCAEWRQTVWNYALCEGLTREQKEEEDV
jgi:hypothetical protein